jgi:hypothetical protein
MAKGQVFNYIFAVFIVFLLVLWYWQNRQPGPHLFPGEHIDKNYLVPVIASVRDSHCSSDTTCPSKSSNCAVKTFKVLRDTTYFLTASFNTADSTSTGCRACAAVYQGDSLVLSNTTSCSKNKHRAESVRLKPGLDYTLSVCLEPCANLESCNCGEHSKADAAVSVRRVF